MSPALTNVHQPGRPLELQVKRLGCLRSRTGRSYDWRNIPITLVGLVVGQSWELWPIPMPSYNAVRSCQRNTTLSLQLTIDAAQRVVIVTFAGEISDADLMGIGSGTKAHPLFDPSFAEIVDFSAVTGGSVSTFAVQTLARRTSIYESGSKHVVIAPQPHVFGLTRMFQVLAEKTRPNMVVVHTRDEACKCLGLPRKTD